MSPKIIGFESPERNPTLIRAITECMYAMEQWIAPKIVKHPQDANKSIFWIDWITDPPEGIAGVSEPEKCKGPESNLGG